MRRVLTPAAATQSAPQAAPAASLPGRRAAAAAPLPPAARRVRARVGSREGNPVEDAIASNPLFNAQFMGVLRDSLARQGSDSLTRNASPAEPRCVLAAALLLLPPTGGCLGTLPRPGAEWPGRAQPTPGIQEPTAVGRPAAAAIHSQASVTAAVTSPCLSPPPPLRSPPPPPPALPRSTSATEEVLTTALGQTKATLQQLLAWRDQLDRQIAAQQKQVDRMEFALNKRWAAAEAPGSCRAWLRIGFL